MDLERLNLRDKAYPFDWLITPWPGIELAFRTRFNDFLSFENMRQNLKQLSWYLDENYQFEFRHDFSGHTPLKRQMKSVKKKYKRRIQRFLQDICEPTLFLRFVETTKECEYLVQHQREIREMIKRTCSENEIIFVSLCHQIKQIPGTYWIAKEFDNAETVVHPICDCPALKDYLQSLTYDKREVNAEYRKNKWKMKARRRKINKRIESIFKNFIHEYKHNKSY